MEHLNSGKSVVGNILFEVLIVYKQRPCAVSSSRDQVKSDAEIDVRARSSSTRLANGFSDINPYCRLRNYCS